ncbi:MAG: Na+/H+ antiporter subunit E [Bacteroidales bacterium]|nr:Na+/H+ antiporter subunit E [Bacteroidales bacterium]MBN2821309.1 Na+/H+ antiporter subunit E [Bacteroidales bacterium]
MKYLKKPYYIVLFMFYYITKLIQSNIVIAFDILTPKMHIKPGFIWLPLETKSKLGLLLLSNLISMTPGTLSIDYDDNKNSLLVHVLYNQENVINDLRAIQKRILKLIA